MQEDKVIYFLQPGSDQAFGLARVLGKISRYKVVAVLLKDEKESRAVRQVYSRSVRVDDYGEVCGDLVVPFGAASTGELLKHRDVPLFDVTMKQSVLSVYEKDKFIDFCECHNLPCPKTFLTEDEIAPDGFPVFFKQKYEMGGGARGISYSKAELPNVGQENLIYQEFIDTPGTYGVGFIAKDGVLEIYFTHFESLSYPLSGGSAIRVEAHECDRLVELTASYVRASNYSGWGLAEFKWCDKRQDFVFMEINAKLWASCEFSFRNEPAFVKKLLGLETQKENIQSMVFINRAFNGGVGCGLKAIFGSDGARKVLYPGLLRAIILGVVPDRAIAVLKNILHR